MKGIVEGGHCLRVKKLVLYSLLLHSTVQAFCARVLKGSKLFCCAFHARKEQREEKQGWLLNCWLDDCFVLEQLLLYCRFLSW